MDERRICSFCGNAIEPGTGKMYIKRDGTVFYFCKNKCTKNQLKLKRVPRTVKWTKKFEKAQTTEAKKHIKRVVREKEVVEAKASEAPEEKAEPSEAKPKPRPKPKPKPKAAGSEGATEKGEGQ